MSLTRYQLKLSKCSTRWVDNVNIGININLPCTVKLSTLNESMSELPATGSAAMHTLQRHREILQGYRQEFNKIYANHTMRIEREELLRGSGLATSGGSPSISGLSRREMYMKESGHLNSASNMVNDQINIAIETRENLHAQRQAFKRMQTRFNDISNRFPLINR